MHHAPRFGHSNRMGALASSNPEDAMDYAGGLKQFTLLIMLPFFFWGLILFTFKFIYGLQRLGCAAGGGVLDMIQLSKAGVRRKERKRRIMRSWRLQTTFCIVSILIPMTSLMMMEMGWKSLDAAWQEVQVVVDDVEALAFRGWNVLESLQSIKNELHSNLLVQQVLKSESANGFAEWCPNAGETPERFKVLQDAMEQVQSGTQELVEIYEDHVPENENGFVVMTQVTKYVDESIDWFFAHDWMWKLLLMVLNVINVLMLLACYSLSKNNIVHLPSRLYLAWLLVPVFTVVTVLLLIATASSGVATMLNADFCAGGTEPGSPQGTVEDAILSFQYGSMDRRPVTGNVGLVYDSFVYYSSVSEKD
jgi:hypothetical protein